MYTYRGEGLTCQLIAAFLEPANQRPMHSAGKVVCLTLTMCYCFAQARAKSARPGTKPPGTSRSTWAVNCDISCGPRSGVARVRRHSQEVLRIPRASKVASCSSAACSSVHVVPLRCAPRPSEERDGACGQRRFAHHARKHLHLTQAAVHHSLAMLQAAEAHVAPRPVARRALRVAAQVGLCKRGPQSVNQVARCH